MSKAEGGLRIVAAPAGGCCDPDSGVCHITAADEAATVAARTEEAAGDVPGATRR